MREAENTSRISKRNDRMTDAKWWDFTFSLDRMKDSEQMIQDRLDDLCDRWAYGRETGKNTGYAHLQGRCVFKVGKELATIKNQLEDVLPTAHWSKTHVRDFAYTEKEGDFVRSWEKALRKFAAISLLEWQEQTLDLLTMQSERQVLCIVNESGNIGKSWLSKFLEATHRADVCPVTDGDASNYLEYCLNHPSKGYVFDVPKADSIKSKKAMWRAIEQIKNGCLYDRRYTSRKLWIDPPRVVIFTNEYPPVDTLSADRWQVYTVCKVLGECKGLQEMSPSWDETLKEYHWSPKC